jgi:predicted ATP-grasp superfamily ATP-dependent carboligase
MGEAVLVLARSGERIRVVGDDVNLYVNLYDAVKTFQTKGTFPGDPRIQIRMSEVAYVILDD